MRHIICLLFVILLIACNRPLKRNNEITKVELARSGAWSDFGAAISIDSSLNYKYYNGNTRKYFTGKITEGFWDTLNIKLEKIKYKIVDTTDNSNIVDANYFELIIHWKNHRRRIVRAHGLQPDSTLNFMLWLNDGCKNVKVHRVNYPIQF
ncbi:MAG TPA: hypothetical protein VGN20_09980 [Mucilaginibacter sp.]|jgi:hypothetical protein